MKKNIGLAVMALTLAALSACFKDTDCINLRNDQINIGFTKTDGTQDTLQVTKVALEDTTHYMFVASPSAITRISVPLNPAKNIQRIDITIADPDTQTPSQKTLEVVYEVKTQFISTECEPRFILSDLAVSNHEFKSAKTVNPTPQRDAAGAINIELSYR